MSKIVDYIKKFFIETRDFLDIVFLTGIREWIDSGKVPKLRDVEKQFIRRYIFKYSPVYIHKEKNKTGAPAEDFYYGEMTYRTAARVVDIAGIKEGDNVYDLGFGRGKFLFYARLAAGARCIGVDLLPTYIDTAQKIAEKLKIDNIYFYKEDMRKINLSAADFVFLHGTTFSDETHKSVYVNLFTMKRGAVFVSVTISYSHPNLELFEEKDMLLSWGKATFYFYRVIENPMSIEEYINSQE